jgi:choline dehydrogenase
LDVPGLAGQRDYWPRGKVLGGSSSINAMVYIRGHRQDFDDWAAAGNPGWSWADVLGAYRDMEDNEAGANAFRGSGGPLPSSHRRKQPGSPSMPISTAPIRRASAPIS